MLFYVNYLVLFKLCNFFRALRVIGPAKLFKLRDGKEQVVLTEVQTV